MSDVASDETTEKAPERKPSEAAATSAETVAQSYRAQLAALAAQATDLDKKDKSISAVRGISFLVAAAGTLYGAFHGAWWLWLLVGLSGAVFVVFVVLHAGLSTRQFANQRRQKLLQRGLARIAGNYRVSEEQKARRGDRFIDVDHPYGTDLDIFGPNSLFEQLNGAYTEPGQRILAQWLKSRASAETLAQRQAAARELAADDSFRTELALAGMEGSNVDRDTQPVRRWAEQAPTAWCQRRWLLVACLGLVAVTLTLMVLGGTLDAPWNKAWIGTLLAQIVLMAALRGSLEPVIGPVCEKQSPLGQFHQLLALIERQRFAQPSLSALQKRLASEAGQAASLQMRRLENLVGYAAIRHNALVYLLANFGLCWDIWCAWALERWRAQCGKRFADWLAALGEVEALASLATFAYEHPAYCWPQVSRGRSRLVASHLAHPLLPAASRVANDLSLDEQTAALMITGSNMSGKSTMLRSIGINAVLAQAGAPVCARALEMSELAVYTCVRINDSLEQGVSRFYAEVLQLKRIVDATLESEENVLFLLDEILHGTNSRERNIGAKTIVTHLVNAGAIGAVSSHDLGLVSLEAHTEGRVRNAHFTDQLRDGKMVFDYQLKDGPVATSNALALMRQVGLDVSDA